MSTTVKTIEKMKQELLRPPFRQLFSVQFDNLILSRQELTLIEMLSILDWIQDFATDSVNPFDIQQLINCRRLSSVAFRINQQPYLNSYNVESQNLAQRLYQSYYQMTTDTDWVIQFWKFKMGRKETKKVIPNYV
jgi:hypothetical protein